MYQVGSLMVLREDDPVLKDFWDAVNCATNRSIDDSVYGVWDTDKDSELIAVVYQSEVFIK